MAAPGSSSESLAGPAFYLMPVATESLGMRGRTSDLLICKAASKMLQWQTERGRTRDAGEERGMERIAESRSQPGRSFAVLGLLVGICLFFPPPAFPADSREPVRIAGSAWVGDAPTWVAERLGLFNRESSDQVPPIELKLHGSGLEALQELLAGGADFALSATTPTALALAGALDGEQAAPASIVVLASIALSNQSHLVISPARNDLNAPADLAGRRIGVMMGTSSHYGWTQFSAFHGLDDAGVELVDTRVSDMAGALASGRIDAAVIWQPWDLVLKDLLEEPVVEFPMRMLYTINWLLLADRDFVANRPDVAQRVLRAYIDAIEFIQTHPDRALELHASAIDIDPTALAPQAAHMLWRVGMNWSVIVNLGAQFEWLATWPQLAGFAAPEPQEYLYGEALKQVAPELVSLPDYLLIGPTP